MLCFVWGTFSSSSWEFWVSWHKVVTAVEFRNGCCSLVSLSWERTDSSFPTELRASSKRFPPPSPTFAAHLWNLALLPKAEESILKPHGTLQSPIAAALQKWHLPVTLLPSDQTLDVAALQTKILLKFMLGWSAESADGIVRHDPSWGHLVFLKVPSVCVTSLLLLCGTGLCHSSLSFPLWLGISPFWICPVSPQIQFQLLSTSKFLSGIGAQG